MTAVTLQSNKIVSAEVKDDYKAEQESHPHGLHKVSTAEG